MKLARRLAFVLMCFGVLFARQSLTKANWCDTNPTFDWTVADCNDEGRNTCIAYCSNVGDDCFGDRNRCWYLDDQCINHDGAGTSSDICRCICEE